MAKDVLNVKDLTVKFRTDSGMVTAVSGMSFRLREQETLCIVGESGSGKSVTAMAIMGLLPMHTGCEVNGEIWIDGVDLLTLDDKQMQKIRGNKISMIFQEPMTALNPVYTIGNQIKEVLRRHSNMHKAEALDYAENLLAKVGVPDPRKRLKQYPHELSGGLRQRVMISMALACNPKVLIADEPTTALDVTIQAQVLRLLETLKQEFQMSIIFITHDMGVVSNLADRIMVMYGGMCMEENAAEVFFDSPMHPYTRGLLDCIPTTATDTARLTNIPGMVPSLKDMPSGCRFSTRCALITERCKREVPTLTAAGQHHYVRCFACKGGLRNE